jgi:Flp pilus assembly protein TadG
MQEQGQDLIELALVLPLLFVILMGVVDVGRAFNTYMVLTNAAREGARQATITPYAVSTITEAALYETRNAGLSDAAVAVSVVSASSGNPVQVTVGHDFALLLGLLPFSSVPLSATVEMVAF